MVDHLQSRVTPWRQPNEPCESSRHFIENRCILNKCVAFGGFSALRVSMRIYGGGGGGGRMLQQDNKAQFFYG